MTDRLFRGRVRRIHFIGIGGTGMNGIAEVLLRLGFDVVGSDLKASETVSRLEGLGAKVFIGHAASNVDGADVVVKSTAVTVDNPEVQAAHAQGIPVIPRAEMLAELMGLSHGIAVAGSHGKTTTTSLIATVLGRAGLDPTVVIGGKLNQLGSNAQLGQGDYMVAEADESDGSFLWLRPTLAVVTNLDLEHVDYWTGGLDALKEAFVEFLNRLPFYGLAVLCVDAENVQALLPRLTRRVVTYGTSAHADVRITNLSCEGAGTFFDVSVGGADKGRVHLNLLGAHNALNAAAAVAIAEELGVPFEQTQRALMEFGGVDRRLTPRGTERGVLVLDDYGHHPTEIRATLGAVRNAHTARRVVVVFQPHRYSRTAAFLDEFGRAFNAADVVRVLPVYAAGEAAIPGVDHDALVASMRRQGHRDVASLSSVEGAAAELGTLVQPDDVVVTMGAGSVTQVGPALLQVLAGEG